MNMVQLITAHAIRQTRDAHGTLFEWLTGITNEMEAIEASSWAELAEYGEEYEGEGFKLRCIE